MGAVLAAWLAEIGLITVRDIKKSRTVAGLPYPSDYAATFLVFGLLGLAKGEAAKPAALAAWAVVIATAMNFPGGLQGIGQFFGGGDAAKKAQLDAAGTTSPAPKGTPATAKTKPVPGAGKGVFQVS